MKFLLSDKDKETMNCEELSPVKHQSLKTDVVHMSKQCQALDEFWLMRVIKNKSTLLAS